MVKIAGVRSTRRSMAVELQRTEAPKQTGTLRTREAVAEHKPASAHKMRSARQLNHGREAAMRNGIERKEVKELRAERHDKVQDLRETLKKAYADRQISFEESKKIGKAISDVEKLDDLLGRNTKWIDRIGSDADGGPRFLRWTLPAPAPRYPSGSLTTTLPLA